MLRSRNSRREQSSGVHVPDPVVSHADGADPEHEALLADSVGLALLVVLDTLTPAERLAFVLHDMFVVPFNEIAPTSCCDPMAGSRDRAPQRSSTVGRPWPNKRSPSRGSPRSYDRHSSTQRPESSWRRGRPVSVMASRSETKRSSRSTCSPVPPASASSA
jgi:hypothetical protein